MAWERTRSSCTSRTSLSALRKSRHRLGSFLLKYIANAQVFHGPTKRTGFIILHRPIADAFDVDEQLSDIVHLFSASKSIWYRRLSVNGSILLVLAYSAVLWQYRSKRPESLGPFFGSAFGYELCALYALFIFHILSIILTFHRYGLQLKEQQTETIAQNSFLIISISVRVHKGTFYRFCFWKLLFINLESFR